MGGIILVTDIILKEWQRNRNHCENKVESLKRKLSNPDSVFSDIKRYTKSGIEQLEKEYIEGLNAEIVGNQKHITEVETFLHNDCLKIDIPDHIKLKIFELSVSNKAPFHNKKNNVADASILFSAADYLSDKLYNDDTSAIFVSNNFTDFTDGKNKNEFHSEILEQFPNIEIKYEKLLPAALNLSKKIIIQIEEYYRNEAWLESIIFRCLSPICDGNENFISYGYLSQEIRVKLDSADLYDPNQLSLFPDIPRIVREPKSTNMGPCSICNSLHIECPECNELIYIEDEDEIFQCPECYSELQLRYDEKLNENCLFICDTIEADEDNPFWSDSN